MFTVKDNAATHGPGIRTEEIELIDEEDVPPPLPETPRRIQFDRTPIPEDQEANNQSFRGNGVDEICMYCMVLCYILITFP